MTQAIIFALANGLTLAAGAFLGNIWKLKQKTIAAFMAFGSGVLICALTFGLMEEAFGHGGFDAVIIGFLIGGLLYIGSDYLLHIFGARKHRRQQHSAARRDSSGIMIMLGSIFDGIPESIALGISLFSNQQVSFMMLAAIVISNVPESVASISGLKKEGYTKNKIFLIWLSAGAAVALATILSFLFLHNLDPNLIGILESLAAGAILAMLADSMMPEAYQEGGYAIGFLTILGFLVTFIMSRL
ncbi:MAG: ZIP family metal transporter [Candidatus Moranbacteria bacterium]|nr:ZIP family metal transporter [Candidatus Moranbacteria bacterium]